MEEKKEGVVKELIKKLPFSWLRPQNGRKNARNGSPKKRTFGTKGAFGGNGSRVSQLCLCKGCEAAGRRGGNANPYYGMRIS